MWPRVLTPPAHEESIMQWITRERPKIDRIACPWLVERLIDKEAEFLYVPAARYFAMLRKREQFLMTCQAWN